MEAIELWHEALTLGPKCIGPGKFENGFLPPKDIVSSNTIYCLLLCPVYFFDYICCNLNLWSFTVVLLGVFQEIWEYFDSSS